MNEDIIQRVENFTKENIKEEIAHDFPHLCRVRNWALKIAERENYKRRDLVEIAALLHDVGLGHSLERKEHGEIGAKMAETFLKTTNLSEEEISIVTTAIKNHDKNYTKEDYSKLTKIIMDADTLELFGAVGISRAFSSKADRPYYEEGNVKGNTWKMPANKFDGRLDSGTGIGKTIIDQLNFQISRFSLMQTETGRELAKPLLKYTQGFVKQLEKEVQK